MNNGVTCDAICQWFSLLTSSLVKIIGKSPHSWPKIVIHGNSCITLYISSSQVCYDFLLWVKIRQSCCTFEEPYQDSTILPSILYLYICSSNPTRISITIITAQQSYLHQDTNKDLEDQVMRATMESHQYIGYSTCPGGKIIRITSDWPE